MGEALVRGESSLGKHDRRKANACDPTVVLGEERVHPLAVGRRSLTMDLLREGAISAEATGR